MSADPNLLQKMRGSMVGAVIGESLCEITSVSHCGNGGVFNCPV